MNRLVRTGHSRLPNHRHRNAVESAFCRMRLCFQRLAVAEARRRGYRRPCTRSAAQLSGFAGTGIVLQNESGDSVTVSAKATAFTFPTSLTNGSSYTGFGDPAFQTGAELPGNERERNGDGGCYEPLVSPARRPRLPWEARFRGERFVQRSVEVLAVRSTADREFSGRKIRRPSLMSHRARRRSGAPVRGCRVGF